MKPYDQSPRYTAEQVRATRSQFLQKFCPNYEAGSFPPTDYATARGLIARLAIIKLRDFEQLTDGDKRKAFREELAGRICVFISGGETLQLPELPDSQKSLYSNVSEILGYYSGKAAYEDGWYKSAYLAQLQKSGLGRKQGIKASPEVETRELAEQLLFTVAEQLAIKQLQRRAPSPVSLV